MGAGDIPGRIDREAEAVETMEHLREGHPDAWPDFDRHVEFAIGLDHRIIDGG